MLKRAPFVFALAVVAAAAIATSVNASPIYFVGNSNSTPGEIMKFTGIGSGSNPCYQHNFNQGIQVATYTNYGSYQGFTQTPNGTIYGVNSTGGVDSWNSLTSWLANNTATTVTSGTYGASGATGSVHGISYDPNTGGFYVVYADGNIGQYASLSDFVNNTNANVSSSGFGGNRNNFYYPGNDAPNTTGNTGSNGSNVAHYFQAAGGRYTSPLEGWSVLSDYIANTNKLYGKNHYQAGAAFAVMTSSPSATPEPASLALLALGGLCLLIPRRRRA